MNATLDGNKSSDIACAYWNNDSECAIIKTKGGPTKYLRMWLFFGRAVWMIFDAFLLVCMKVSTWTEKESVFRWKYINKMIYSM